jgi:hypothetical protein
MLFQSQVPQLFNKIGLELYSSATQTRKIETAKRLNFYHDEQLDRLNEQLNELFSDPSSMVQVQLNIVKKVINNLAQVYREPPVRTLEGSEKDQELYKEIAEGCNLDIKLKQASRYCKLLKTIILRPVWRNERLDLDILTGNILDVVTGDVPEVVEKVLITNYGNSDKVEDVTFSLWTPETWSRLDFRGNVIEQAENPYKILPFLPVFDYSPPSSAFWLPGGSDLVSLQEAINLKLTDLIHLLSCQSFGVGYIRGSTGGANLKVDPGSLVELPENGEIGFESQKAEIEEVVNAIDKLIKWCCVSNGLSAASMSTDASEASGLSKIMDSKELSEMRTDDIALWRNYEKQLFNLIRIVHNTHSTKKLSDSAILSIDFADIEKQTISPKDQATAWDLEMSMGLISTVDILLIKNADFQGDREKAMAHLLTVREENKELTE